jgi:manganese transport protein
VAMTCTPTAVGLVGLLTWLTFRREEALPLPSEVSAQDVIRQASAAQRQYHRIGVALDAQATDAAMLAEAVALAKSHRAELVLIHVVDGVGGTWYGDQTGDAESRDDEVYLNGLAEQLGRETAPFGIPVVDAVLGYGDAANELVRIAKQKQLDLMVLGGHGHRGISDILHGETITRVRHQLNIPIVAARS